jgi:hypothetical protein
VTFTLRRRRIRRAHPLVLATVAVVVGCVTGCSSRPQGSVPAASAIPVATTAAVADSPSASTPEAATDLGYRVTFTSQTDRSTSPVTESTYPRIAVTGGPDPGVRDAVRRVLEERIEQQRSDFADTVQGVLADQSPGADPSGQDSVPSTQEITVGDEVRWDWLYAVRLDVDRSVAGAAHPSAWYVVLVVDWRTGRQVDITDLYPVDGDLQRVDAAVRAGLQEEYPDLTAEELTLTVAPVSGADSDRHLKSYPTPDGLRVVVDRCQVSCAAGALGTTISWSRLPPPRPGSIPATT